MFEKLSDLNARILLVEDVETNQIIITALLETLNCVVDIAKNGLEGFEKAVQNEYDTILMDIRMPVMDGFESAKKICAHQAEHDQPYTPIVAVTAYETVDYRIKALSVGMDDFITKPVDRDLLELVIREWTGPYEEIGIIQDLRKKFAFQDGQFPKTNSIDQHVIEEMCRALPESAPEIIDCALNDLNTRIKLCQEAFSAQDYEHIVDICHAMKPVATTIGAHRLSIICAHLSDFCKTHDTLEISNLLKALMSEFAEIQNHFENSELAIIVNAPSNHNASTVQT